MSFTATPLRTVCQFSCVTLKFKNKHNLWNPKIST
jgi:hypothetical protein